MPKLLLVFITTMQSKLGHCYSVLGIKLPEFLEFLSAECHRLYHIPSSKLSNLTPVLTNPFTTNSINPFKKVELSQPIRSRLSRLFPSRDRQHGHWRPSSHSRDYNLCLHALIFMYSRYLQHFNTSFKNYQYM